MFHGSYLFTVTILEQWHPSPLLLQKLLTEIFWQSMSSIILFPKAAADCLVRRSLREEVSQKIRSFQATFPRFHPQLCIVQAGERPDSSTYVRMKAKAAEQVGIKIRHIQVPSESSAEQIVRVVQELNVDESVSGILVQLPLGDHITSAGERLVTEAVSPQKDVDGYVPCISSPCLPYGSHLIHVSFF